MRYFLLVAFTLAGCATVPEKDPVVVTKTVEVPVPVKCVVSYPDEPSPSVISVPATASRYAKAQAVVQELEDQRQYAKELKAILSKCAANTL